MNIVWRQEYSNRPKFEIGIAVSQSCLHEMFAFYLFCSIIQIKNTNKNNRADSTRYENYEEELCFV